VRIPVGKYIVEENKPEITFQCGRVSCHMLADKLADVAAEKYEDEVLGLKPKKEPETILEVIALKMFEYKLTQTKLATKIGIGQSKVSEILSGKRKPHVSF
jgi:antitoxin component HigA of HigAB toxin-antitoxin module